MGKRDGEFEPVSGYPPCSWCCLYPEKPGLGNGVGRTESGYVFLLICLLKTNPQETTGEEYGHGSLGPQVSQVMCVWRVLPVALFWFGFTFLRKELEFGKRGKREKGK